MAKQFLPTLPAILLLLTFYALPILASPSAAPHSYDHDEYPSSSSGDGDQWTSYPSSDYAAYPIPPSNYGTVQIAHAVLASIAVLFFFPLGGIIIRVSQHRNIVWIHGAIQVFGLLVFAAAAGCGIWMADQIWETSAYHPIIGMVLLGLLALQPMSELINHRLYQRYPWAIYLAHVHLWLGRILITLGIINGGLGFAFASSHPGPQWSNIPRIVYGVVGTVVWVVYVAVAIVWQELKVSRKNSSGSAGIVGEDMEELRAEDTRERERTRAEDDDGPGPAVRERQFG